MAPVAPADSPATTEYLAAMAGYLDASPTPFHAVAEAAAVLTGVGYTALAETDRWPTRPGRYLVRRSGSLVAWDSSVSGDNAPAATGFRIVGAHTDSPNLRIKPRPDYTRAGWQLLGVETYGGPLLNSWLDRDLGLAGQVTVRDPESAAGWRTELVLAAEPLLRVSQLAVHLHREVNDEGLRLNPQLHLAPHWGVGDTPADFTGWLAEQVDVAPDDVLGWDMMTFDLTPARRLGRDRELLASGRLDNLATCFAAVSALVSVAGPDADGAEDTAPQRVSPGAAATPVIVLFDHEEVGSTSDRGAQSTLLPAVLERIVAGRGGDRQDFLRALAATVIASGDMAHAIHPNYPDRHEPQHPIAINGGPVLKINNKGRYATDAAGAAAFALACEQAGVPMQQFVVRSDLPSGSTVGPMTAALTGATTVDFGAPMLSMHSAREVCGAFDQPGYAAALAAFLAPRG